MSDYQAQNVRNNLAGLEPVLEKMIENKGKIGGTKAKPATSGGGSGSGDDDDGKDKLKAQIMEAIVAEKPDVKWDDIAGLSGAKEVLKDTLEKPLLFPNFYKNANNPNGINAWKGILLYGPPGTGKTLLAKACATMVESTFYSLSSSDLISKFVGESEKLISILYETARNDASAIIFLDEIDSLCSARSEGESEGSKRVKTEFLVQMDGAGKDHGHVLTLGATNIPWNLDGAILRRFQKRVYIDLPEIEAREYFLNLQMKKTPHNLTKQDFTELGKRTVNYSGADLAILCKDAAMEPLRVAQRSNRFRKLPNGKFIAAGPNEMGHDIHDMGLYDLPDNGLELHPIERESFEAALLRTKPTVALPDLIEFEKWTADFGQDGGD